MKWFLLLLLPYSLIAESVKSQFLNGKAGDYVVFEQSRMCTLFHIHSINEHVLTLEEIGLPSYKKPKSYKEWVKSGGNGASSWNIYEIDLKNNRILESFDFSKKSFFTPAPFLLNLINLSLEEWSGRPRIGPPPMLGDFEGRKLWNPPCVLEGKKIKKQAMEAYISKWPKDQSPLSEQNLTLYFVKDFPFPYWIEINDPEMTYKLRAIDSGHGMQSPRTSVPRQSIQIIGNAHIKGEKAYLLFKSPPYFELFDLIAIDQSNGVHITLENEVKRDGLFQMHFSLASLTPGKSYTFIISPKGCPGAYSETREAVMNSTSSPSS